MATLRAYLGVAGLTDVGYQLYLQNGGVGSREETGVIDEGEGWYSVTGVDLLATTVDNVHWDSTGTPDAIAREDLAIRIKQAEQDQALAAILTFLNDYLVPVNDNINTYLASTSSNVETILSEIAKIPRQGTTFTHTNTVTAATATVAIT